MGLPQARRRVSGSSGSSGVTCTKLKTRSRGPRGVATPDPLGARGFFALTDAEDRFNAPPNDAAGLALSLRDQRLFDAATNARTRSYIWIGALVVATVIGLAVLALGLVRRQAALAQLRNDLVANVTHELKTPLSSMRLLVETLLDAPQLDEKIAREYLELIAKENVRLSRLIDNFLTFSRIERNKYTFDFKSRRQPLPKK